MAWKRVICFLFLISSITQADEINLTKIVSLDEPWGSSFINEDELILTEKEGKINSNYIEYHENGSKCINVDFGDDPDDRNSRSFPYNLGEYANDKSKVKNR